MKTAGVAIILLMSLGMLSAQNQTERMRVHGKVERIPADAPAGWLRVTLRAPNTELEVSARSDGTFEFPSVPRGRIGLDAPDIGTEPLFLNLDADAEGIVLTPRVDQLFGRVEAEGGYGYLPTRDATLRIQARGTKGKKANLQFIRSDGVFGLSSLPADDYTIRVDRLPPGYSVKSIQYAGTDLLQTPLKVVAGMPLSFMRITLGRSPNAKPDSGDATLIVSKRGRGKAFTEGSLLYFALKSTTGNFKEDKRLGGEWCQDSSLCMPSPARGSDSLPFSIPAGDYELRSYVRGCDGNCGRLGRPEDECRATFKVHPGETLYAERLQHVWPSETVCALNISTMRPD
jgi:hypothetical protein